MTGPKAELRLVDGIHYRRDAFAAGLEQLGFHCSFRSSAPPRRDDTLVLWNRYGRDEMRAREYEASGAAVFVVENAWLGPEEKDRHWFAIQRGHHNTAGSWRVGSPERIGQLGLTLKDWRRTGSEILILPQRGMGERGVAQPSGWLNEIVSRLSMETARPVRIRKHPGLRPHPEIDWSGVWACVTWASGAALKALVAGIPVFYEYRDWVGAKAAVRSTSGLEEPFLGDRIPMLADLAWAMWRTEEIVTGDPFRWLLYRSPFTSTGNSGLERKSVPPWPKASPGRETSLA